VEGTIGGIQVLSIVEVLHALGTDRRGLRSIVGMDFDDLDDPWVRFSVDVARGLFAYAEKRTGDRLVGLHAGERSRFRGPIAHLLASAPRLRPALELYGLFSRLAIDTSIVQLGVRGGTASLVIALGDGTPTTNRHLIDYTLIASIRMCWRRLHEGYGVREVHVRHPARYYDAAAEIFRCPVQFQRPDYRIVFPARDLDVELRSANPLAGAQIEKGLATLPATTPSHPSFAERVEHCIHGLLMAGHRIDQASVAKRLHLSVRSLQRRLGDERTSFRAVRNAVLRAIVEAQLWNPALSIKEIAHGLGFGDAAALSKAFRRWTGQPPSAFRAGAARRDAGAAGRRREMPSTRGLRRRRRPWRRRRPVARRGEGW
jgi:AraC-like DNA-binding protein